MRRLVEGAIDGVAIPDPESPSRDELLELLAERARQGNVAALRILLARDEQADPRERALAAFEQIATGRES